MHDPLGGDTPEARVLDRECDLFTRYLVGKRPTEALRRAYREGHARIPFRAGGAGSMSVLDRWTLRVARLGRPWVRAADAYHRFFQASGILRQKLTLMLALLEHAPPFHVPLNRGVGGGPVRAVVGLVWTGGVFVLSSIVGLVVLGPVHLWTRVFSSGRSPALGEEQSHG